MTYPDIPTMAACATFYNAPVQFDDFLEYVRANKIDATALQGSIGAYNVLDVYDCGNGRFEFTGKDEPIKCFVCEAFGKDGETVIDLVACSISHPDYVMSMFGRCAFMGEFEAMNPATYLLGQPLEVHRNLRDWLKAGCKGAAVVTQHQAARMMIDLPGMVAAQDYEHGRELEKLANSVVVDRVCVLRRLDRIGRSS